MSVVDSQADRELAIAKIAAAPVEILERDLAFWCVASADARHDYDRIQAELYASKHRFNEAETFQTLIAEELRKRRDARVEAV